MHCATELIPIVNNKKLAVCRESFCFARLPVIRPGELSARGVRARDPAAAVGPEGRGEGGRRLRHHEHHRQGEEGLEGVGADPLHQVTSHNNSFHTLWGVHSVAIFCRAFLKCSAGCWADTVAAVPPNG